MFSRSQKDTPESSTLMLWTGRVLSGLFALFMAFDAGIKLLQLRIVEESMAALGYPPGLGLPIGGIEAVLLVLYLVRRTSVLGAVLFMGILGGAVASHLRMGDPLFSHILFGVYLGLFAWGGLWLRDPQLRAIFPLRRPQNA
ncbi:MAG TPA: DoxX family protein [Stellaceae bacterium]|nr:DoxX family protein [Stellaceae bacterium]